MDWHCVDRLIPFAAKDLRTITPGNPSPDTGLDLSFDIRHSGGR
jgi:hypothetical protein